MIRSNVKNKIITTFLFLWSETLNFHWRFPKLKWAEERISEEQIFLYLEYTTLWENKRSTKRVLFIQICKKRGNQRWNCLWDQLRKCRKRRCIHLLCSLAATVDLKPNYACFIEDYWCNFKLTQLGIVLCNIISCIYKTIAWSKKKISHVEKD